jgi:putative ABC transport system permease protein
MRDLLPDLRWALRALRRRPGFTALAVITLALGIGANSAIFSVVRAVLLRPLPYAEPDRLVSLHTRGLAFAQGDWLSQPEIADIAAQPSLEGVAAYSDGVALNLTGRGEPERAIGAAATASLFSLLGISPLVGRTVRPEEDLPDGPSVVVLSHGFWRRSFGADPSIVGTTVVMNGVGREVLGVMPPEFTLPLDLQDPAPADFWIPIQIDLAQPSGRGSHYLFGLARLRPGATVQTLNAELAALSLRLTAEGQYSPESRFALWAQPVQEQVVGGIRPILVVLLTAVGFVLLIACVNVANLLVARAEARTREFAVRTALGAARGRLLRQLVVEHALLGLLGGALGLGLAALGVRALVALDPTVVPRAGEIGVDGAVLLFTGALAGLAAMLFGLAPMVHAGRRDVSEWLKEGGARGATAGVTRQRFRQTLVAIELALSIVLLAGAGLTLRTFQALLAVDPGFEPRGVLTMRVVTPAATYPDAAHVAEFYRALLERARALPGVQAAGAVRVLPLAATIGDWSIDLEGRMPPQGEDFDGDWQIVTPGYFEAMGVRLLAGRLLSDGDHFDAPPVAVINQTMARQYWPDGSALGQRFRLNGPDAPWIEIVGVVRDEKHLGLGAAVNRKWYRPHAQWTQSGTTPIRGMTLVARTAGDPLALVPGVREAVRAVDPGLPVAEVRTLEDVVGQSVARQRFTMLLLGVFAAVALTLGAVGVYGVMASWVTERTHEIGVRMALGATRREVAGLVVRQALAPAGIGALAGGAAALLLTRLLQDLLYGVPPHDPLTFVAAPILLALVAVGASWLPARRAAGLDPVAALRRE